MNCDSVTTLLDEVPMARWTSRQQVLVREHCDDCHACSHYLRQQQDIGHLFEELQVPSLARPLQINTDAQPLENPGTPAPLQNIWPGLALVLICLGSAYKVLSTSGITPRWIVDGSFFESTASFMINTPILSALILLLALLFSFSPAPSTRRDS
jgi:hypothetical protein